MEGHEFTARTGEEAIRAIRALGAHRYVAGRLHFIHAFAIRAASHAEPEALREAAAWADSVITDEAIDKDSKDERLYRRATDAELVAVLRAFWVPSEMRQVAHDALSELLESIGRSDLAGALGVRRPFVEEDEDEMFPVLVDAGWELLPLMKLDPEKHKGVIDAYGDDPIAFESAKFEEWTQEAPRTYLHELPAIGEVELLDATDEDGDLVEPLVLWWSGEETYNAYLLRGVARAARLPEGPWEDRGAEDDGDEDEGA